MSAKRFFMANVLSSFVWAVLFALMLKNERVRKFLAPSWDLIAKHVVDELERRGLVVHKRSNST